MHFFVSIYLSNYQSAVDLTAEKLKSHLHESTTEHLLLSVQRMHEHQAVIASLHKHVKDLESCNQLQDKQIKALDAALVASTMALKASETRQAKLLQDEIYRLDQKSTKSLSSSNSATQNEITSIKKSIQELFVHVTKLSSGGR